MNSLPLKTAAKLVGCWGLLVVVVAVLTALFSLLGTIVTSVLTGMMVGTSRRWKWQAIPISLTFPLVALTLGQTAKADLELRQRLSLAALCFGSFWATYLLTLVMMCLEKPVSSTPRSGVPAPRSWRTAVGALVGGEYNPVQISSSESACASGVQNCELTLQDLQGIWHCETNEAATNGPERGTGRNKRDRVRSVQNTPCEGLVIQ